MRDCKILGILTKSRVPFYEMWASRLIQKDSKELQEAREKLRRAQANGGRDCSPDTRRRMEIAAQYKERKAMMLERVGMEGYLSSLPLDRSPFPSPPSVPNSLYSFRKVFILNLQRFSSSKQQANAEDRRERRRKSKKSRDPVRHAAANAVAMTRIAAAATATALLEGQRTCTAVAAARHNTEDPERHLQKKVRFADDLAVDASHEGSKSGQV